MSTYVREIVIEDFNELSLFLAQTALPRFFKEEYLEKFDFWWFKNPYFKEQDAYGWIIVDDQAENSIKGFLGNIPVDYRYGGAFFRAVSPTTWCVDDHYKKHAIYLFFAFYNQDKDIFVNSTAGEITRNISLKFGCVDISSRQKTFVNPVSHKIIEYFLVKKIKNRIFVQVLAHLLYSMLKTFSILTRKLFCREEDYKVQIATAHSLIDELQKNSNNLYIERLEWVLNNDQEKKLFFISDERHGEKGYLLIQYTKNRVNGLNYLQVIDSVNIDMQDLGSIQNQIIRSFHEKEICCIVFPNASPSVRGRFGYIDITRYMPSTCLVYGKKAEMIRDAGITALFGEKGLLLWH